MTMQEQIAKFKERVESSPNYPARMEWVARLKVEKIKSETEKKKKDTE